MRSPWQCLNRSLVVLCALLLSALWSCEQRDPYVGRYLPVDTAQEQHSDLLLELKENGEGVWRTDNDEVPLQWHLKGEEIRLTTKSGGIVKAQIKGDTLILSLPGPKKITFRKTGQWGE